MKNLIRKILKESVKNKSFDRIIVKSLERLKYICETENSFPEEEVVGFEACDLIDSDVKIDINNIVFENNIYVIYVVVNYNNYNFLDSYIDDLIYEIKKEIKETWAIVNIDIKILDSYNEYPQHLRQW